MKGPSEGSSHRMSIQEPELMYPGMQGLADTTIESELWFYLPSWLEDDGIEGNKQMVSTATADTHRPLDVHHSRCNSTLPIIEVEARHRL